ncbi:MAG: SDR family NAD(P)-dependent oxidoreductase [Acidobacteriota bacterium]|nr:SDR family NAD(P)-dependent oxidoreductase [Acidobacteriota bacterium]
MAARPPVHADVATVNSSRPVALVTGASSGIGAAYARRLASRGYDLILVARREERLRQLADSLDTTSQILAVDLATAEGLAETECAIRQCETLDMLVNNAGFGTMGRFWEAPFEGQVRMHELHVMVTMRLTHAALCCMVPRGTGSVINVSSVAAFGQSSGNVSYCATKAWINSFTTGLDMELRSLGSPVKVQALCPGFTQTEFHQTLGMDWRKIPNVFWMQADDVVETSLTELASRKVIVVPKWRSKVGAAVMKHLPAPLLSLVRPGGKRV